MQPQDGRSLDAAPRAEGQGSQEIQGHDPLPALTAGGRQLAPTGLHGGGAEPEMGGDITQPYIIPRLE